MNNETKLPYKVAEHVYMILIGSCGATNDIYSMIQFRNVATAGFTEYRFMGSLGFGGKIYNSHGELRVGYYPEDKTKLRDAMVEDANEKLSRIGKKSKHGT